MSLPPEIEAALRAGDRRNAARLAHARALRGAEDPEILHLAAHHCMQRDELDEALDLLNRARCGAPHDGDILNTLANLHRRRGEGEQALTLFRRVCADHPANTAARFNLARLLEDLGDRAGASEQYRLVIDRAPSDSEALSRLFYLAAVEGEYESAETYGRRIVGAEGAEVLYGQLSSIALQRGDYAVARRYGELAAAANPAPRAIATLAQAEFRDGEGERALHRLNRLLAGAVAPADRAFALSVLADIEDALGRIDAAFDHYTRSKAIFAELHAPQFARPGQRTARQLVEDLHAFFAAQAAPPAPGADGESPAGLKGHVFLVGFPRSGTTLLEQSLALHPALRTLDESGRLMETSAPLWSTREGLEAFAAADNAVLSRYRAAYWRDVHATAPDLDGKILIDKVPLNCLLMGHIQRMFPKAKILFAIRDPRDVALSCFRTRFTMTAFMYEFCTIHGAAQFYDRAMSLCDLYRSSLALPVLDVRYEDSVRDFPGALAGICEFIGVAPVAAMAAPERRARSRIGVTPSGQQIARGLYDGSRQWRRYTAQLAPVMPVLEPWARRFGYSPD